MVVMACKHVSSRNGPPYPCGQTTEDNFNIGGLPFHSDHFHCLGCNACLGRQTDKYLRLPEDVGAPKSPRIDQLYCTNACRQRAYRKRRQQR